MHRGGSPGRPRQQVHINAMHHGHPRHREYFVGGRVVVLELGILGMCVGSWDVVVISWCRRDFFCRSPDFSLATLLKYMYMLFSPGL